MKRRLFLTLLSLVLSYAASFAIGPITGPSSVCVGSTITVIDTTTGGLWISSNPAVATVSGTGPVGTIHGISAGTAIISYSTTGGGGGGGLATMIVTVSAAPTPIAGPSSICLGSGPVTYTSSPPGGSWSASTTVLVISPSGVATPLSPGTAIISYTLPGGCSAVKTVNVVSTLPPISGTTHVCVGSSVTLTDAATGGAWSTDSTGATFVSVDPVTGVVTGLVPGTASIVYSTGACSASIVVTVNASPAPITGPSTIVVSTFTPYTSLTPGGAWASSNISVASIGGSGMVNAVSVGTATLSYTKEGCTVTKTITVTSEEGPAITGPGTLCVGSTGTFSVIDSSGGNWYSSHSTVAAIDSETGVLTALSAGTTIISYVSFGGGTSTMVVTITAAPPAILGPTTACVGSFITLTDAIGGGIWTSSNPSVASVVPTAGFVTAMAPGTATITYTLSSGCFTTVTLTVNASTSTIGGPSTVCVGSTITLTSSPSGGLWSSSNSSVATIGATTGIVTGISAGTTNITYSTGGCFATKVISVINGGMITGPSSACIGSTTTYTSDSAGTWSVSNPSVGTIGFTSGIFTGLSAGSNVISFSHGGCVSTKNITVSSGPAAITGGTTVCAGSTLNLADLSVGGTWATSNPAVATVDIATGVVTGIAPGTATIFYTLPTGCSTSVVITVGAGPGAITGPGSVCVSSTITLSTSTPGGAWNTSNILIASVNSAGVVTGVAAGTAIMTYQLGGCKVFKTITVNSAPAAIVGPSTVCVGSSVTLSDPTPGGSWSSADPTIAFVNLTTGVVTGMATGVTNISYTTSCGTSIKTVTVNPGGSISGPLTLCVGSTVTESGTPAGGTWSASSSNVTLGLTTGIVTGVTAGTAAITYTIASGCTTVRILTINPLPAAIGGPATVAVGGSITLSDASIGGIWSSSAPAIATVGAGSGMVNGVSAGIVTISYTLPTGCSVSYTVTVTPTSTTPPITGPSAVCQGTSPTYTETVSGTWSSSNGLVAIIGSTSGILTPLLPGTTTITFVPTTGSPVTMVVTVNPQPTSLSGMNVCVGGTTTFTTTSVGGTWVSGNTSIATIGATSGVLTGISAGATSISYVYVATGCATTIPVTVNPNPAPITGTPVVCVGGTSALSSATAGGTWSTTNPAVATVSPTGVITGVAPGTVIINYILPTTCWASITVTVTAGPSPISGPSSVCVGSTITLADATGGGTWSSSSPAVASINAATGVVTGVSAGGAIITYTIGSGCSVITTVVVTTGGTPISGPSMICLGGGVTYTAGTGGTWSSSNTSVAVIGSASGILTGVSMGVVTISYNAGGCISTKTVTVVATPSPIAGPSSVCAGSSITLLNAMPGGTWSVAVTSVATVNATTGVLTGIAPGTTAVTYTIPGGCSAITVVTVNAGPAPIGGPGAVCVGGTITLFDATSGGTWSSSTPSVATVGVATGIVTGVSTGISTISYTVGGCTATKVVTVTPAASPISGPSSLCVGASVTYTDATSGGGWSSSNPSIITINGSTGVATGIAAGVATISYTTGCGSTVLSVTVNPGPSAISGPSAVCAGGTITLSSTPGGGTWSSSAPTFASVNIATGVVTGIAPGAAVITYKLPSGCFTTKTITINSATPITGPSVVCSGTITTYTADSVGGTWSSSNLAVGTIVPTTGMFVAGTSGVTVITFTSAAGCMSTKSVTVVPNPAAIGGPSSVCVGGTITLTDVTPGGTWSSSNPAVATISPAGVVTGVTPGTTVITYALPSGCMVTRVVTVTPGPSAISGPSSVCVGSTITLTDAASGGVWSSSSPAVATVGAATGIVTGVSTGTVTITYSIGGCMVTKVITVTSGLPGIVGSGMVCVGASITLFDTVTGGMWSVNDSSKAFIGSTSGVLTGLSFGTVVVTYSAGGCMATKVITVNSAPAAISGPSSVCVGGTITLTDATPGGVWSSSNSAVATVNAAGIVAGVSTGSAIITYMLPSGCFVTKTITVTTGPSPIVGPATVCTGSTITMSDATPGGTWSSSNPSVASINATTGVVTGISNGSAIITYSIGGCFVTKTITVGGTFPIAGPSTVCVGSTITLFDSIPGGHWLSLNPAIASVDSTSGVVTGNAAGVTTISYIVGGCVATKVITVTPGPAAIVGPGALCVGSTATYSDATAGGTWSSTNTSVATINATTGVLTAVGAGVTTIKYTTASGCTATKTVTVTMAPFPIAGPSGGCVGSTFTLMDSIVGGVWSSSNTLIATIGVSTGIVTGVHAGVAVITYTIGSCSVTKTITITAAPAAIVGASSLCVGTTTALTDATPGGIWSSSNTAVAVVSSTGLVTGVHSGVATILYTVGGCSVSKTITVNAAPAPIVGSSTACIGTPVTYFDSVSGGIWTSSSPFIAAIGSTSGILTPLASGVVTITYSIGGCSVTKMVTVSTSPAAITGSSSLCVGTTITLSDPTLGGTWSSSNTAKATVSASGMVTGVSAGVVTITYTKGGCYAVKTVTVNNAPGPIGGPLTVCVGTSITLTNATPGGTWLGSNPLVATVNLTTGSVTGVAPGFIVAYYTAGGCSVYRTVTVNAAPKPITGPSSLCAGSIITLADLTSGGIWISSNIAIAMVNPVGVVTGVSAGLATISYTLPSTGCSATKNITVNPCGKIAGSVKTGAGRGTSSLMSVTGMLVELQNAETHEVVAQTYTDEQGAYSFYELGLGDYVVYPKESGFTTIPSSSIAITKTSLVAENINFIKNNGDKTIAVLATTEASTVTANAAALSIYPNPSNGDLNISWENQATGMANVVITNVVGSEVYKGTLNVNAASGQTHIDLKNLKSGIYLINITSDNISYSSKLFIQQ